MHHPELLYLLRQLCDLCIIMLYIITATYAPILFRKPAAQMCRKSYATADFTIGATTPLAIPEASAYQSNEPH